MKESLRLIDEIIQIERERDKEFRKLAQAVHKSIPSDGQSQIEFYLNNLKELVEKETDALCQEIHNYRDEEEEKRR